jgi:O-antigen/teichoic acid export membrane protein
MQAYFTLVRRTLQPLLGLIISEFFIWFGIPAVLTRALGPVQWGEYSVLSFLAMLPAIIIFGTSNEDGALARFLVESRNHGGERRIYSAILSLWITVSLAAILLVLLIAYPLCRAYEVPQLSRWLIVAALPTLVLMPMVNHFLAAIQGYQRVRRWALVRAGATVAVFAIVIVAKATGILGKLENALVILACGWLLALVLAMLGARPVVGRLWPDWPDRATLRMLLRALLPAQYAPVAGAAVLLLLPFLLARYYGPESVGYFMLGRNILIFQGLLHAAVMVPLLPEWAQFYEEHNSTALLNSYRAARMMLLVIGLCYAALFIIGGEGLVAFLFGDKMRPATPVIRTMVLCGPLLLLSWLNGSCIILAKKFRLLGYNNALWGIVVSLVSIMAIPRLGAVGAAWGWFAGYIAFWLTYVICLRPFFAKLRAWQN